MQIGQGDLPAAGDPPAAGCLAATGVTHLHANQGGRTQVRIADADALLAAQPDARRPSGCTGAPHGRAF